MFLVVLQWSVVELKLPHVAFPDSHPSPFLCLTLDLIPVTGEMIIANDRYLMNETDTNLYAVTMTLTIKTLNRMDFGGYKCISKNSIGDADQTVRLYRE